jgi:hypothetical protein
MADEKPVSICVNIGNLRDNYLAEIQNLADIVLFICAGHESVARDKYGLPLGFISVEPAANRKLTYEQAKEKSADWLLASFLRDSVDVTTSLLDESRRVCALWRVYGKKMRTKGLEWNRVMGSESKKFHRLGFPDKFRILRTEFGVHTQLETHFLSLNSARNCLVHRRGIVSHRDTNEDQRLVVKWRAGEMVARAVDGDSEVTLTEPTVLESESDVFMRIVDKTKAFNLGQKISFERTELYQNIFTLFLLACDLVRSVEDYGKRIGTI